MNVMNIWVSEHNCEFEVNRSECGGHSIHEDCKLSYSHSRADITQLLIIILFISGTISILMDRPDGAIRRECN